MKFLLDTSTWVRSALKPGTLPDRIRDLLSTVDETYALSVISVWEVAKKVQVGKLTLPLEIRRWVARAITENIMLLPLDEDVLIAATELPSFSVRDPADEIIVATARQYDLTLITSDRELRGYKHARIHYFKPRSE